VRVSYELLERYPFPEALLQPRAFIAERRWRV